MLSLTTPTPKAYRLVVADGHENEVVRIARWLVDQPDNPFGSPLIDILAVEGLPGLEAALER